MMATPNRKITEEMKYRERNIVDYPIPVIYGIQGRLAVSGHEMNT